MLVAGRVGVARLDGQGHGLDGRVHGLPQPLERPASSSSVRRLSETSRRMTRLAFFPPKEMGPVLSSTLIFVRPCA